MRPVSDSFLSIVRGPHQMVSHAYIVTPGQTGVTPVGIEIPILSGDVKLDSTADIRATLELETSDQDWMAALDDAITPYGNEVFVQRGIVYGDGSEELVSQGYYRIYSVEQDSAPKGSLRVSGRDRMSAIVDDRPLAPIQFGEGASVASVFDFLVSDEDNGALPGCTIVYDFDAGETTFASSHALDDDRYGFLKDIADSLGKVMYFDYAGRLRVESAPNPTDPVWTVNHGENGVVVSVSRTLSRDQVYNAVIATGESVGENPPVRGIAMDLNPNSPTYWYGPFGRVPKFYSSTFLTTDEQCEIAAQAMLAQQLGVPYSVDFDAVPNPALEPLDPVLISYDDRKAPEIHVIESLTIPLDPGATMRATTKQQIKGGLTG